MSAIWGLHMEMSQIYMRDFLHKDRRMIRLETKQGSYNSLLRNYQTYFSGSFLPYLMTMENRPVGPDTWDNLINCGHACGVYNHKLCRFQTARELGMDASDKVEMAYVEALDSTYRTLKTLAKS